MPASSSHSSPTRWSRGVASTSPSSFGIANAVRGWSPVIMITRMLALRMSRMAIAASSCGGSMMPLTLRRSPPRTSSAAASARLERDAGRRPPGCGRAAPTARRPAPQDPRAARRRRGPDASPTSSWVRRSSRMSGAPLADHHDPAGVMGSPRAATSIALGEKGISPTLRNLADRRSCYPSFRSATRNAASVGSPWICHSPPSSRRTALLA